MGGWCIGVICPNTRDNIDPRECNTYHSDIFKHLNDGRVHEIVSRAIVKESLNYRFKEKVSHDVAIVEFIFQTDYSPHKAQST